MLWVMDLTFDRESPGIRAISQDHNNAVIPSLDHEGSNLWIKTLAAH